MSNPDPDRRYQVALDRARTAWSIADLQRAAGLAGCALASDGVLVPFFGALHLVTHPDGQAFFLAPSAPASTQPASVEVALRRPSHVAVTIALLHYLLTADGVAPSGRWLAFRELPDGLFYASAFAGHEEAMLARRFGQDLPAFGTAASALGGLPLDLADASFGFQALPRLSIAALIWEGDDELPAQARILFDASAPHYLPTEDLSGLGDWLAHRLTR